MIVIRTGAGTHEIAWLHWLHCIPKARALYPGPVAAPAPAATMPFGDDLSIGETRGHQQPYLTAIAIVERSLDT